MCYKLGSLFDGSGGFPLAGTLCGIEPVWAAEVEPYPIAVTRSRFPKMRHLGDISKVNGAEIEPVDIITFGSPCQDLSVAGKRAGLKHEANGDEETTRSGLFMEAVRIIKEMRSATNGEYPRFALWENVPGAFSSNNGEDFRLVCEELIKIVEPSASMPAVPQNGWNYADSYIGDGWSLAYRVFDAQYWGVPQRRRRIHLVADFRGASAREILFEREGLRGYFATGRTPWQGSPAYAQAGAGADDREGEGFDGYNGDLTGDKSATLGVNCGVSTGRNGVIERGRQLDAVAYTLKIRSGCEGGGKGALIQENKSATLATNNDQYLFEPLVLDDQGGQQITVRTDGISPTLRAEMHGHPPCVYDARGNGDGVTVSTLTGDHENRITDYSSVICLQGNGIDRADTAGCKGRGCNDETCYTLNTIDRPAVVYAVDQGGGKSSANVTNDISPTLCTTHGGEPAGAYTINHQGGNVEQIIEEKAGTLTASMNSSGNNKLSVAYQEKAAVYALDRASFNQGQNAKYDFEINDSGVTSPIVAKGPSAVAYSMKSIARNGKALVEQANPICASDYKDPDIVAYGVNGDRAGTLDASYYKGCGMRQGVEREVVATPPSYIVRRLTPTECARLQGFADWWGHIEEKKSLTDEEYHFWLEVRNTHAAINGRATKDYTKKAMLTWYNKLWTDSAEYKMWGNGIALPPALYCLQGIADALTAEDNTADDDWMN